MELLLRNLQKDGSKLGLRREISDRLSFKTYDFDIMN